MLFPRNALASGPQAWLEAEKGLFKVKVGKHKVPSPRQECRANLSQDFFYPLWESGPERIIPEVWGGSFFYPGWLNLDGGEGLLGGK
jgi:hypothetical protein